MTETQRALLKAIKEGRFSIREPEEGVLVLEFDETDPTLSVLSSLTQEQWQVWFEEVVVPAIMEELNG